MEQKEFSFQPSLILNLLNTLSTTEITQQNWEEISPCWLQPVITSKVMHYLQQRFCHLGICWVRCFHTQSWSSSSFQSFPWLFKPIAITRISTLQLYSCTALVTLSYHRSWFYWKNNCFSMVYVRQNFYISFFKWQKSNSNANLRCFVTYNLKLLLKSSPTCMLFSHGSLLRSTDMIAAESNCRGHTKRSDIAVPNATSLGLHSVQTFLPLLSY